MRKKYSTCSVNIKAGLKRILVEMNSLSIVIITFNEEKNIVECIRSAKLISDDIIVVDACSTDETVNLARNSGANVFSIDWKSYGFSRNYGALKAKNNWILALDADERISGELALSIRKLKLPDTNLIYKFYRTNYLNHKRIRFGTLGFETVKRIYNRNYAQWDLTLVHEKLESLQPSKKLIAGCICHYGLKNEKDYKSKAVLYAQMSAEKIFAQGKKATLAKRYFSPAFNSIKSYIFQFGFLDGRTGWISAKTIAYYSWLKYFYLNELWQESQIKAIPLASKHRVKRA
jgi:glycosyltransferase involved in cell wall biosynthesis